MAKTKKAKKIEFKIFVRNCHTTDSPNHEEGCWLRNDEELSYAHETDAEPFTWEQVVDTTTYIVEFVDAHTEFHIVPFTQEN